MINILICMALALYSMFTGDKASTYAFVIMALVLRNSYEFDRFKEKLNDDRD